MAADNFNPPHRPPVVYKLPTSPPGTGGPDRGATQHVVPFLGHSMICNNMTPNISGVFVREDVCMVCCALP
eukprot:4120090-Pyramimonas_sp.AAC.1